MSKRPKPEIKRIITLEKEFPNPKNLETRIGIKDKVHSVRRVGDKIEVAFKVEPTALEIEAISNYFDHNPYWKITKNEKTGVKK